jgi:hypothetical protein
MAGNQHRRRQINRGVCAVGFSHRSGLDLAHGQKQLLSLSLRGLEADRSDKVRLWQAGFSLYPAALPGTCATTSNKLSRMRTLLMWTKAVCQRLMVRLRFRAESVRGWLRWPLAHMLQAHHQQVDDSTPAHARSKSGEDV